MSVKVNILKKVEVEIDEYWVIRGIKDSGTKKEVVAEFALNIEPNALAIAQFLVDHPSADFCTIEHNYKLIK